MRDYSKLDYLDFMNRDFDEITEEQAEQLKANRLITYWEYIDSYTKSYGHGYYRDYKNVLFVIVQEDEEDDEEALSLHFIIKEG